jgi:hypothetical protein
MVLGLTMGSRSGLIMGLGVAILAIVVGVGWLLEGIFSDLPIWSNK